MIKLGIIGTGRIAKRAVKEVQHVDKIAACAVLNPNKDHAEAFAKENDIEALTNEDNTAVNLICELKVNEYNSIKTPMGIVKKYEVVQKEKPKINWDEIFK